MPLTPSEQAELNGLLEKHGLVAAADGSGLEYAAKLSENLAQGATMGWADEFGSQVAKPFAYALKNALPESMGGEDVTFKQVSDKLNSLKNKDMSALSAFNQENPVASMGAQLAGGGATAIAGAGLLNGFLPKVGNALTKFAASSPYLAASGANGVVGTVYGAGAAPEGETAKDAAISGALSVLLGPALVAVGRKAIAPAIASGKGALQKFLATTESAAPQVAAEIPAAPISDITNAPLVAGGESSMIGKLPLSQGVKTKDPNLLRIEEQARQGNLGQSEQNMMQAADAGVYQDARKAVQQLKGVTNKDSDSILSEAVAQFQKAGNAVKTSAQALYKKRDEMMADAVLNKKKVGPSLGKELNDVTTDPSNTAGYKSKAGADARQLYEDFKTLISSTKGNELPFSDLAAWRSDVSHIAGTDKSTSGNLAKKLGKAYDSWMDNLQDEHLLSGNPEVAATARAAGAAWKNYKTLFGSENSPIIEGMTKPYDMKPMDFVDGVFGKNIEGTAKTALNMRKMTAALPEEAQKEFKENVFKGLVSRVFEGAGNADSLSLAKLRNNLSKLQSSQTFKEFYSADGEKNTVITNLIKDLSQHIEQTGRRDVTSPSGGAIMRGINKILSVPAQIPLVNKIPMVKVPAEIGAKAAELDQKFMDKKTFNTAMKAAAQQAHKNARTGQLFDLDSLKLGVVGGISAGGVVNKDSKENKK